jgi:haloalkane dehalogenase
MRDFCFNKDFLDEWKKRFPLARIKEFPNAGHYLFEDALTGCIAQIREFLKEHIDPYICK